MSRVAVSFLLLLLSQSSGAQNIPTVVQWVALLEEVHQHALFQDLRVAYVDTPAANVGYSPVGVVPKDGVDCVVVISSGENPKMVQMMKLPTTPVAEKAFLLALAAHELGHCFRIRSKNLSVELWDAAAAAPARSAQRKALEKLLSIEEAYADAYAFAYTQDAHPDVYAEVFGAMHSLRHEPAFAHPFYQLAPLYEELSSRGLDARLSFQKRVEAAVRDSKF